MEPKRKRKVQSENGTESEDGSDFNSASGYSPISSVIISSEDEEVQPTSSKAATASSETMVKAEPAEPGRGQRAASAAATTGSIIRIATDSKDERAASAAATTGSVIRIATDSKDERAGTAPAPPTNTSANPAAATSTASGGQTNTSSTDTAQWTWCLNNWRFSLTGLLWLVLQYFRQQGHLGVEPDGVRRLEELVPATLVHFRPITLILSTLHTLAAMPGVLPKLREWDRRSGRIPLVTEARIHQHPSIFSGGLCAGWSCGLWGLNVMVLNRFLEQGNPNNTSEVLAAMDEIRRQAGTEAWIVEIIVEILMFVKSSPWTWGLLF